MLKICERFSVENSFLFNKKKTICIKFGSNVKEGERAILDSSDLLWTDNVVHLGNYVNSACTNLHRYPGTKPCNALYVYSSSLYSILLSTGNQCNSIKARDIEL